MTVRDLLLIPGGVFERLSADQNVRIVLIPPRSVHKKFEPFFAGLQNSKRLAVEPIDSFRYATLFQRTLIFFTKYLVFTDTMKLLATEGVRTDAAPAGGHTYLYALKWLIYKLFGRSKWLKDVAIPALFLFATRERPYAPLFERYRPDLVFIPDVKPPFGLLFLAECRRRGIRSIQMPGNWDHFKYYFPLQSDYLLTTNEPLREEAVRYENYPEARVTTVGFPQFDYFLRSEVPMPRDAFCARYGFAPEHRIVLFVSEGVYSLDGGDVVDAVLRAVGGALPSSVRVLLRPYPPYPGHLGEGEKYGAFEKHPLVAFATQNSWKTLELFRDFINLLYHADAVICTYSTVAIEALVFGKPVINIGFDGYRRRPLPQSVRRFLQLSHFQHVTRAGGVRTVQSPEELVALLSAYLKDPQFDAEARARTRDRLCHRLDGAASARIAAELARHLHDRAA